MRTLRCSNTALTFLLISLVLMRVLQVATIGALLSSCALAHDYGIVNVDDCTMTKVIDGSRPVILRIDRPYPYGQHHEEFITFAKRVAKAETPLLLASVGIDTYGSDTNHDIAIAYGVIDSADDLAGDNWNSHLPRFFYLPTGSNISDPSTAVPLRHPISLSYLHRFTSKHGLYIPAPGTIRNLNRLAPMLTRIVTEGGDPTEAVDAVKLAADKISGDDYETATQYLRTARNIVDKGVDYLGREASRLHRMMSSSDISPEKRGELERKLSILEEFKIEEV